MEEMQKLRFQNWTKSEIPRVKVGTHLPEQGSEAVHQVWNWLGMEPETLTLALVSAWACHMPDPATSPAWIEPSFLTVKIFTCIFFVLLLLPQLKYIMRSFIASIATILYSLLKDSYLHRCEFKGTFGVSLEPFLFNVLSYSCYRISYTVLREIFGSVNDLLYIVSFIWFTQI